LEKFSFSVAEIEAPLDLILQLIQKHKLNILDIDISSLLEQYLKIIENWQSQDLEVSSEFLEMASRLVYMKTVSLLPRHEEDSDELRRELTGQLIEYSVCKLAAENLGKRYHGADAFSRPQTGIDIDPTYTLIHPAGLLFAALADAMGKNARRLPPPKEAFEPLVNRTMVSVTAKIFTVLRALRLSGAVRPDTLYLQNSGRSGVVATFLALLELIKAKKITLKHGEINLAHKTLGRCPKPR
jgi:segregation and condensation protein A